MVHILSLHLYLMMNCCYCCLLSLHQLFVTPRTVALQAPPSMGFPRKEHSSGLPFPYPGDLSDPGIETMSPTLTRWILLRLSHLGSPSWWMNSTNTSCLCQATCRLFKTHQIASSLCVSIFSLHIHVKNPTFPSKFCSKFYSIIEVPKAFFFQTENSEGH